MRENLHQSNPAITITITAKIRLRPNLRGDAVVVTSGVPVSGGGVMDGLGEGVIVIGLGVSVDVAGGVTRRSNFDRGARCIATRQAGSGHCRFGSRAAPVRVVRKTKAAWVQS